MKESDDLLGANCLRRRRKQHKKKERMADVGLKKWEYKSGSALMKSVTVGYTMQTLLILVSCYFCHCFDTSKYFPDCMPRGCWANCNFQTWVFKPKYNYKEFNENITTLVYNSNVECKAFVLGYYYCQITINWIEH